MSSPALEAASVAVPALPKFPAVRTPPAVRPSHPRWQLRARADCDRGMTTAEYAVGTVAACGFGGVLYKTVTSDVVARLVADVIRRALTLSF